MIRKYDGKDLAKVLIYYGIVGDVTSSVFSVICPFHEDINPSMRIDLDDGTFFCFGCRVSGNAYDFVKLAQPELSDLQVAIVLEKILHSDEIKQIRVQYKKKHRINNKQALIEAKDYYYGLRTVDWNRPTTKEEHETLEYMQKRGFNARALNIANCKVNCNVAYPFVFPILDNKKFKGWVGRTTNKYVENKRKYLYNEGFRKRDTLCGNYEKDCVPVICEGYMDYLSLRTRGKIKNVVALLGWHISDEQIEKLKQNGVTKVISALDNDKMGIKGTEYLKKFFDVIRFEYPENIKDAGDMTEKQIKQSYRRAMKDAVKIKS